MTRKTLGFSSTEADRKFIKKEQERLESVGLSGTISEAIRSLIFQASTTTDTATSGQTLNPEFGKKSK